MALAKSRTKPTSVEICAGAGGQAVGLHQAGFQHRALIEIDKDACATLLENTDGNPEWQGCRVIMADLKEFDTEELGLKPGELDLLAGGVPCPPFSFAGRQLGKDDERDLFPRMLEMVAELQPKAVMIENVRGLLEPHWRFAEYRDDIKQGLKDSGYEICGWEILEACNFGVPQLRPRAILVAMLPKYAEHFTWPEPSDERATVAKALKDSMYERFKASGRGDWEQKYHDWYEQAGGGVAPTLVGGSKKHGGADLGPTRAKKAWEKLGVCGLGVANEKDEMLVRNSVDRDLYSKFGPKLTVRQAAQIQGFPEEWRFSGRKTAAYRQVGNAFPPPVARAVGLQIAAALEAGSRGMAPPQARKDKPGSREPGSEALFEIPSESRLPRPKPVHRSGDLEGARVG